MQTSFDKPKSGIAIDDSHYAYTALMKASSMGHDDVVGELLNDGADVNANITQASGLDIKAARL